MCMNKQNYLLYKYSNENKNYFESVHTRLKKIVQEKTYKPLWMFGKTAYKAKLLNGYVTIARPKI